MMYSPRSVSTGVTPMASSASLRWISSVAIDLDFTAIRAPVRRAMSSTTSRASSAVVAKCTWPPSRSTFATSFSRCSSRRWRVASLMARARSRRRSPSGKSPKASRRSVMNLVVAISSASCRNRSPRAWAARCRSGVLTIGSVIGFAVGAPAQGSGARRSANHRACSVPFAVGAPAQGDSRRLASPLAAARTTARWSANPRAWSFQDLGEVQRAERGAAAQEAAADLHEAAGVARHQAARAGGLEVGELALQDRGRDLGQPHRERAAEATAFVAARQRHHAGPLQIAEQDAGRLALMQAAQKMTRVVIRQRALDVALERRASQPAHEQLGELPRALGDPLGVSHLGGLAQQARVLVLDHPGARA